MFLSLLMLIFNRGYKKANRFLAGVLFCSSLYSLLLYVFLFSGSVYWSTIFVTCIPSSFFLLGPFSFFYVRSILRDNSKLSRVDYLHFVLFLVCLSGTLPFLFSSWENKLIVGQNMLSNHWNWAKYKVNSILPYKVNQGIRPFHIALYMVMQWKLVWRFFMSPSHKQTYNSQWHIIKKWLLIYCTIFTLLCVCFSLSMIKNLVYENKADFLSTAYSLIVLGTVGYFSLIILLFFFPQVVYGLPVVVYSQPKEQPPITISHDESQIDIISTFQEETETADRMNFFSEEYGMQISGLLINYLQSNKHLSYDCTLSHLSDTINIPSHHLSYYFNNIIDIKFTDWRNNNRIDYATALIVEGELNNRTLEAIALKCGFTTQSTFIRAFKQKTGVTPSVYLKKYI